MTGIVAVDPGLICTAAVAYDPTRDEVLGCESWRFAKTSMSDPERVFAYAAALAEFLEARAPVDVFAIEDQQASAVTQSGRVSGWGRGLMYHDLPEPLKAHVDTGNGHCDMRAAQRGGKNRSMIRLAKLAGALEQEAERRNIRVVRVQPQEAKRALTGESTATKGLMRNCARAYYGLTGNAGPEGTEPNDHIADSVGIALAARALLRQEALTDAT